MGTVMAVNDRSTATQNPVYPVYPCLNPSPFGREGRLQGRKWRFMQAIARQHYEFPLAFSQIWRYYGHISGHGGPNP